MRVEEGVRLTSGNNDSKTKGCHGHGTEATVRRASLLTGDVDVCATRSLVLSLSLSVGVSCRKGMRLVGRRRHGLRWVRVSVVCFVSGKRFPQEMLRKFVSFYTHYKRLRAKLGMCCWGDGQKKGVLFFLCWYIYCVCTVDRPYSECGERHTFCEHDD